MKSRLETPSKKIVPQPEKPGLREASLLFLIPSLQSSVNSRSSGQNRCSAPALLPSCKEDRPKANPLAQRPVPGQGLKKSRVPVHLKPCSSRKKGPDIIVVQRPGALTRDSF